jgi:L-ribulose-5-phosphate 4-epimerase
MQMPAVLVANHGPFTWGDSPATAVEATRVLEEIAAMALGTITINPDQSPIDDALLDKHYLRKHGTNAYYGQEM